ncbi:energy-coupling factor transporter ATPase [uncultured Limosilactobacillus sp.]|uniref:energy-coupling factor transporter ATPase n=1 Tax=uncultured Limosilactobacillus sp. TaxID=2837629 RepID=UPI0025D3D727|nr:energy-coupling factor transporter ATPase [uncultured Limosilactobacillus sp.]
MAAIVTTKDLTYRYTAEGQAALDRVSLTIPAGQWTAIIGHNGSGKSTLARLIDGLLAPTAGSLTVAGMPMDDDHVVAIRHRIGYVFQNPDNQFIGTTVGEDVAFGLENHQVPREKMQDLVEQSLDLVGMSQLIDAQPASLSGGQKQRVALAGVLAMEPDILILDEATSMLDPAGREQIDRLLVKLQRERQMTIISITHDAMETLAADSIIIINDGHLVKLGPADQVLSDAAGLLRLGLAAPFAGRLKLALEKRGIAVPTRVTDGQRMVEWLCSQLT